MNYKKTNAIYMTLAIVSLIIVVALSVAAGISSGMVVDWYLNSQHMSAVFVKTATIVCGILVGVSLLVSGALIPRFFHDKYVESDFYRRL